MSSDPRERIERMRANPKNVRYEEMISLLKALGYRRNRGKGSHQSYTKSEWPTFTLSVPHKSPHMNKVYVGEILDVLEERLNDERYGA